MESGAPADMTAGNGGLPDPGSLGGRARFRRVEHIEAEMKQSYLDYAMSVIIGRALPDVRDGLKPGQRRVLYAMYREGLLPSRPWSKCAGIVGEVLKKYHPHGDQSVYDTLVRLAQSFNLRHPMIDGKGNFGSVDGDPAAAYRYTEARLTPFSTAMMEDIDRNTVPFAPNFDGRTNEPQVLPTVVPNLLVNGSDGIAVGMATKIPPHNLREVTSGLVYLIENPDRDDEDLEIGLLHRVPGPDFPTGGRIHGRHGIVSAYRTGRGVIQVRAVCDFETTRTGGDRIVVSEIPYQVNKARLIEKIADLVKDKRITGISDLRDESDRRGMRIVIDLKRGEEPQVVLNNLYRHTALQSSFGMNLLAISGGRPRRYSLLAMLRDFLAFRRQVVRRRVRFELERCEQRLHLLEGLAAAVDRLDEVIEWIRSSPNPTAAREKLQRELRPRRRLVDRALLVRAGAEPETEGLSETQAQAILDMRLQRLTQMERDKIEKEIAGLEERIGDLSGILRSPARIDAIVREEAEAAAKKYGDDRRTEIADEASDLTIEELIPVEDIVISVTQAGYIKRTPLDDYRAQSRGGKGHSGAGIREGDAIRDLIVGSTHSSLLFLTDEGVAYRLKGYELPEGAKAARGRAIVNLLRLPAERKIVAVLPLPEGVESGKETEGQFVLTATRNGLVKRTRFELYANLRATGLRAVLVREGDELLAAALTRGSAHVVLTTRDGWAIRFREDEARPMGRVSGGVKGISLRPRDEVVSLVVVNEGEASSGSLLTVTRRGYGKKSQLSEYRLQGRGGQGLRNISKDGRKRNGPVVATVWVRSGDELLLITAGGKAVRTRADDFRVVGRNTMGDRALRVRPGDEVVAVSRIPEAETDDAVDPAGNGAASQAAASEPTGNGELE